jgi:hypothetical protein
LAPSDEAPHFKTPRPTYSKVIARAVLSPWNVSVAGASLVGAAAFGLWPVAALGGVAYAALVAWDLASPDFWRKTFQEQAGPSRERAGVPKPETLGDATLAALARSVVAAHAELEHVRGEAGKDVAMQVAAIEGSVAELEERAGVLLRLGDQLAAYLVRANPTTVEQELLRLRATLEHVRDPEARKQYEQTVAARNEQLTALADIRAAVERISANVSRIVATIEGLSARVVRMGALDAQATENLSVDVNTELENMNREIASFEQTLRFLVSKEVPQA